MNDLEKVAPAVDPNADIFRTMVVEGARIIADGNVQQERERTKQSEEETKRLGMRLGRHEKSDAAAHRTEILALAAISVVACLSVWKDHWEVVTHLMALLAGGVGGWGYANRKKEED